METIKERLILFIKTNGLSQKKFEENVGLSNGYINNISKGIGAEKLQKILCKYPELNPQWLVNGDGSMLKVSEDKPKIPYYKNVPVSAGTAGLMEVESKENAVGFINITGVTGKYAFPVVGCSMEPIIHAGDIVVVDELNSWDRIDPDKIYLIFTHEDRMIKHIETDEKDDDIIWCVSPNYKRFHINKSEIFKIYKVTFYGRLA